MRTHAGFMQINQSWSVHCTQYTVHCTLYSTQSIVQVYCNVYLQEPEEDHGFVENVLHLYVTEPLDSLLQLVVYTTQWSTLANTYILYFLENFNIIIQNSEKSIHYIQIILETKGMIYGQLTNEQRQELWTSCVQVQEVFKITRYHLNIK